MGLTLKIKLFNESEVQKERREPRDERPLSAGFRCKDDPGRAKVPQFDAANEIGPILHKLRALATQAPSEKKATYRNLLEELNTLVKEQRESAPADNGPEYIKFSDFVYNDLMKEINADHLNIKIHVKREPGEEEEAPLANASQIREKVINMATHTTNKRPMPEIRKSRPSERSHEPTIHSHNAATIQDLMTKHLQQMQIQSQNYAACALQNTVTIANQLAELAERFTQWQPNPSSMPKDITLSLLR